MHFSWLSGQEYTVPGLFIANGIDDQPAALPIAPMPLPAPGSNAPPAPVHGEGVLDQGLGARRRDVHRHEHAQRIFERVSLFRRFAPGAVGVLDELDPNAARRFDVAGAMAELIRLRRRLGGELHAFDFSAAASTSMLSGAKPR